MKSEPKFSLKYTILGSSKTFDYPKTFKTFRKAETKADSIIGQIHIKEVMVIGIPAGVTMLVRS